MLPTFIDAQRIFFFVPVFGCYAHFFYRPFLCPSSTLTTCPLFLAFGSLNRFDSNRHTRATTVNIVHTKCLSNGNPNEDWIDNAKSVPADAGPSARTPEPIV